MPHPAAPQASTTVPGPQPLLGGPDPVRLAIGTLCALPVRPPRVVDARTAGRAMLLAPAVGAVLGALAAGLAAAAGRLGMGDLLRAALVVALLALATRALHLDGLADTADGLTAGYDRDRALAVMRAGNSGPAGVAAVALTVLIQVAALAQALGRHGPVTALVAVLAGRIALPIACRRPVPAARPGGLGAAVAGSVSPTAASLVTLAAAALAAGTLAATDPTGAAGGAVRGGLAVLVAALAAGLLTRRARRRLGGITGDVLGAGIEAATTAALLVLAAG